MDAEEYANVEWTLKCNVDQWSTVQAVLSDWAVQHYADPDARDLIKVLKTVKWERTR